MFSPVVIAATLFVRYASAVPCALCGRRSKHHWTSAVRFKAADLEAGKFSLEFKPPWLQRGAPVCRNHIMQMDPVALRRAVKAAHAKK